jgi:hypothetical protein
MVRACNWVALIEPASLSDVLSIVKRQLTICVFASRQCVHIIRELHRWKFHCWTVCQWYAFGCTSKAQLAEQYPTSLLSWVDDVSEQDFWFLMIFAEIITLTDDSAKALLMILAMAEQFALFDYRWRVTEIHICRIELSSKCFMKFIWNCGWPVIFFESRGFRQMWLLRLDYGIFPRKRWA